jgi:aminoglycoside 6'-N-acetyltransferase
VGFRVRGRLTELRSATAGDIDLLVGWHADPEVARYWDGETFTREEMAARLERRSVEALIVEEEGEPVGYLQVWEDEEEAEAAGGAGGLDMFLVPGARGRGLGPDAARAIADHLVGERGWHRVTVDPYLWNQAAVRAWRRAGFRDVEEREPDDDHSARWLLMEFGGGADVGPGSGPVPGTGTAASD